MTLRLFQGVLFDVVLAGAILMGWRGGCSARTLVLQWNATPGAAGYRIHYQADSPVKPFRGSGATEWGSPVDAVKQTNAAISGLDPGRGYYFAVTSYSAAGVESFYSNIVYVPPLVATLSVNLAGNGGGSVHSSPAGIACTSGSCTAQFTIGSPVTLLAAPASGTISLSYLSSWSGCSRILGVNCAVDVGGDTVVTASFATLQPVRVRGGAYYSLLQGAYRGAGNGGVIQAQAVSLTGDLTADTDRSVTLTGGYNADYSGRNGVSTLRGKLTVTRGALTVDSVVIR